MLLDLNGKAWDLSESWKDRHREVSNAIKPTVPRPCRDLCLARSSLPKRPEPHTKSYSAAAMSTMPWCVRPSPFSLFAIFSAFVESFDSCSNHSICVLSDVVVLHNVRSMERPSKIQKALLENQSKELFCYLTQTIGRMKAISSLLSWVHFLKHAA